MRFLFALLLASLAGCNQSGSGGASPTKAAAPAAPAAPVAYAYPAPVKGHYKEVNTGDFDLVDGVAYATGSSTTFYATEKPIASPILAGSACVMAQARALTLLRKAHYVDVRLNAKGDRTYFEAGQIGGGAMTEKYGRSWKISGGNVKDGRAAGTVSYKPHGQYDFDLPVSTPASAADSTPRTPTNATLAAAYTEVRRAALAKDLKAMLAAQGFDAKQVEAIRGLAGIDADFAAHANLFLDPGTPEEPTPLDGGGRIGGRGKNSKGAAFFNFYTFATCGDKLVLVGIGENPQ